MFLTTPSTMYRAHWPVARFTPRFIIFRCRARVAASAAPILIALFIEEIWSGGPEEKGFCTELQMKPLYKVVTASLITLPSFRRREGYLGRESETILIGT